MFNEGISFRNNYTPRNSCSTGNNEFASMVGFHPINYTCTVNHFSNNRYFTSVFNRFREAGYTATSYHNFGDHYYPRRTFHAGMGSQRYRNANDLGIRWTTAVHAEWPSDVELVDKAYPHFINDENFMVYLTTVSPHQPFHTSSTLTRKNNHHVSHLPYSANVRRYMAKLKELDYALERLIEILAENGRLEDTVIAAFSDHYPMGLGIPALNEILPYAVGRHHNSDRTPMFIWHDGIERKEVDKFTSIIDLLPTLLNMFNLDYDPRHYMGNDIMSKYHDLAILADGSWRDAIGYYSATSARFTPLNDLELGYTADELREINRRVRNEQSISALMIRTNYFDHLQRQLRRFPRPEEVEEILPEE
jgi:phosphoglycerol transferase MdoB-like AlkP superfamily enzyme